MPRESKFVRIEVEGGLQHYYVRDRKWGHPAGRIEPDEIPEQAAHRELIERTGYAAEKLEPLGKDGNFHVFRASKVKKVGPPQTQIRWKHNVDKSTRSNLSMNTKRIIHLHRINQKLDPVINFDYGDDDDERKRSLLGTAATGAGAAGVAGAGLYAGGLYRRGVPAGGLAKTAARDVSDVARGAPGALADVGRSIGAGARGVVGGGKNILAKLVAAAKGVRLASKMDRLVQLNAVLEERVEFAEGATAYLLGNPVAAALNARRGKKLEAFKDAYGNRAIDESIGGGAGALAGGAAGLGVGLTRGARKVGYSLLRPRNAPGIRGVGRGASRALVAGIGAAGGALAGGIVGSEAGAFHGNLGKRAQELRHRYD
jgi:hypothetical protein